MFLCTGSSEAQKLYECGGDGPIIVQETVKIKNDDTEETLSKRILAKEHKAYPEAVRLIAEKKISVVGRKVKILS